MKDLEHARALLRMAQKDLAALRAMGDREAFADEVFGFHAEQAAEKALKAWAAGLGCRYPFRHDLGELLSLLERQGLRTSAVSGGWSPIPTLASVSATKQWMRRSPRWTA